MLPGREQEKLFSFPPAINLVKEAFELADPEVLAALAPAVERIRQTFGDCVRETSLAELCGDERAADSTTWLTIYRVLQGTEMLSCLGAWIEDAKPEFGPAPSAGLHFVRGHDRTRIGEWIELRERYCRGLGASLAGGKLLCLPSAAEIAPLKGSKCYERTSDYYQRMLPVTAIAGVGRLPQISMPLATVAGVPIGLSLVSAYGEDHYLLEIAKKIAARRS
jgi:amidase